MKPLKKSAPLCRSACRFAAESAPPCGSRFRSRTEGARLLGLRARGVVATRNQDHQFVVRTDPYLVPIDPGIGRPR